MTTATIAQAPVVSAELYEALMGGARTHAAQTGFGWSCARDEHDESGSDQGEYATHMKAHGARALSPSFKRIKLRKTAPAAALPKLEVNPFKWAHWHQEHTEPGICECGHTTWAHSAWHGNTGVLLRCESCECKADRNELPPATTHEADRRGQYLANGPAPHSVWVIPFEAAPWETGNAAPVLLYAGKAGRYFTEAYSAKYDRR